MVATKSPAVLAVLMSVKFATAPVKESVLGAATIALAVAGVSTSASVTVTVPLSVPETLSVVRTIATLTGKLPSSA
jgi:hypothetical protein